MLLGSSSRSAATCRRASASTAPAAAWRSPRRRWRPTKECFAPVTTVALLRGRRVASPTGAPQQTRRRTSTPDFRPVRWSLRGKFARPLSGVRCPQVRWATSWGGLKLCRGNHRTMLHSVGASRRAAGQGRRARTQCGERPSDGARPDGAARGLDRAPRHGLARAPRRPDRPRGDRPGRRVRDRQPGLVGRGLRRGRRAPRGRPAAWSARWRAPPRRPCRSARWRPGSRSPSR